MGLRALVMALPTYNLPTKKPGVFTAPAEPGSRTWGSCTVTAARLQDIRLQQKNPCGLAPPAAPKATTAVCLHRLAFSGRPDKRNRTLADLGPASA